MDALERRKTWIAAALGKTALDLIIRNVHLVNVYTGSILLTSLGIKDGHIVTLHADGLETADTFDAQGQYALPGLIDTHVHLDSTLLAPENLGQLIVPHGTTAMLTDPMESANVGGFEGLRALLTSQDELPYHLLLEVSSRVPTAPGLETTGGELDVVAVQHILSWETSVSLGELDPSKVLGMRDEYLQKVLLAHQAGKIANGHAAGLTGRELEAYVCGGLSDDHETLDYREALERLRYGLPVLIREGSTERNLELILKGVIENGLDTRHLMFCTDDKHPDDILEEGHIDYMVNRAIEMGLDPIRAIQMATLNAAEHFRLEQRIGSLTPGREADILLTSRLDLIQPTHVFFGGQLVARDGKMVIPVAPENYPSWFFDTVHVTRGRQAADFRLPAPTDAPTARVNVIEISGEQILNQWGQAELPVQDGRVMMNPAADLLKLAVVERHGKNGNIGITFVKGFGLKRGALASSVSHDHHNIVIVGTNDEDMAVCVRAVAAMHGGLVVAAGGEVLASLPLPLGGLMSDRPVGEVIDRLNTLNDLAHHLGSELPAPFMTLSFISLPTVPELGLTDLGLVDVRRNCLISPFAE
jgi:adenine deaminase